jgi:hypothetical protein
LAISNWQSAIGNQQLAISNWQSAIGNQQLAISNWQLAISTWPIKNGSQFSAKL